jgi:hypothetical protein
VLGRALLVALGGLVAGFSAYWLARVGLWLWNEGPSDCAPLSRDGARRIAVGLFAAAYALFGLIVWSVTRFVRGQDVLVHVTAQLGGMVSAFFVMLALGGATSC